MYRAVTPHGEGRQTLTVTASSAGRPTGNATGNDASVGSPSDAHGTGIDTRFTSFLLNSGALTFGDFMLKSGRRSPYFINAGAFNDGRKIAELGEFYAERVIAAIHAGTLPEDIGTVFGPAYKGIPLAVATAMALHASHGVDVGYTFDRKEAKDHGDGGMLVGTPLTDGMKVLLVDDVMTAGTAVREVIPKLRSAADVQIVGLILSVDRMERGSDPKLSAVASVEREFGFPVISIANIREIFDAASTMTQPDGSPVLGGAVRQRVEEYWTRYSVQ